jgi:hypothetical protein
LKHKKSASCGKSDQMSFVIVAGCYEKAVFGWNVVDQSEKSTKSESSISLQPLFVNVAHDQSIRVVGAIERFFVTGSADQSIK